MISDLSQVSEHRISQGGVSVLRQLVECKLDLGPEGLRSEVARLHVPLNVQQLVGHLPGEYLIQPQEMKATQQTET